MASSPAKLNLKILAFVGSVREGRMATRVTKLVESFYKEKSDGHTLEIIGRIIQCIQLTCMQIS